MDFDDVEDMLEAPFRKSEGVEGNGDESPASVEGRRKKSKHRRRNRRSRSRSHSPRRKHKRSRSRGRRQRSGSRDRRRKSGSRDGRRRSGSRDRRRRSVSKDGRQRSGSRDGRRRSGSRDGRRRSGSRDGRQSSESRDMRRRSGSGERRQMAGSRDRRRKSGSKEQNSPPRRPSLRGGDIPEENVGFYRRVGGRSPDPEPPSEERDRRTVMCMQLAAYVGPKELEEFFQKVGQVKEVKMIADKNSRRSKGIAYIEFHDENSVPSALQQSGQKLFGVPIIVQPTMAEKNRLAAAAQNLMKKEGPRNLYVGSLDYHISEDMLKKIFEPFGYVEKLTIQRDENNLSKGYGFVEFRDSEAAARAKENLNMFELCGRAMKVNHVTDRGDPLSGGAAMEFLDSDNFSTGVGMTPQARASLMAKLAEGHNASLMVPTIPALAQPPPPPPLPSSCFVLSNMFDPVTESEPDWEEDIREDVLVGCAAFGDVVHIHVDTLASQGNVFVKCANPQVAKSAMTSLDGRHFAGKLIIAKSVPEGTYHMKFPGSASAVAPLKSSQ